MTAREHAVITSIQAVDDPLSDAGALAIAAAFNGDRDLFDLFLHRPDAVEAPGERLRNAPPTGETWWTALYGATVVRGERFEHLREPVAV